MKFFSNPNKPGTWTEPVQNVGIRLGKSGFYKEDGTGFDFTKNTKIKLMKDKQKDEACYHNSIYNFSKIPIKDKVNNLLRNTKLKTHKGINNGLVFINKKLKKLNDAYEQILNEARGRKTGLKNIKSSKKEETLSKELSGKIFNKEPDGFVYEENGIRFILATKNLEKAKIVFDNRQALIQSAYRYLKKDKNIIAQLTDLTIYSNRAIACFRKMHESYYIYMNPDGTLQGTRSARD